ncbi:hypothetical protein [Thermomonospora umbrina]|uniref:ABC transporter permease n=1 Tax=Thermomonospora umbrina TaxID=111806 RepID=A0A3D9STH3_9ACTN|nr:hypothetical protein [Thermomonospora umbrina]REE99269.1 hypothetical protein DFJ69_4777 [Thermomonospora umbrina]
MNTSLGRRTLGVTLAATVIQLVMVVAFGWPAARSAPHDLPIAVAGPQSAAVADRLARQGGFEIAVLPDEAAARRAVTDRDAYGAIVTTPAGPKVLVASAASPQVAQQIGQYAATLSGAPRPPVTDVVSAGPHGTAFGTMVLPLVMSGIAAAVLLTLVIPALAWRLAGLVGFAVLGGLGVSALAQGWLDILDGSYLTVAAAMALTILAVTGTVVGLAGVIGRPGIGVGALTMLLLGNPLSGASSAPELLPEPWGDLGQLLPPGAGATLLRSYGYFDGAGAGGSLAVLGVWAAVAVALILVAALRDRSRTGGESADAGAPALVG